MTLTFQDCGDEKFRWDEKALELMQAVGKMNSSRRNRGREKVVVEEDEEKGGTTPAHASELLRKAFDQYMGKYHSSPFSCH